jgi:hypothetical protein
VVTKLIHKIKNINIKDIKNIKNVVFKLIHKIKNINIKDIKNIKDVIFKLIVNYNLILYNAKYKYI